jgi:hypothetical protein
MRQRVVKDTGQCQDARKVFDTLKVHVCQLDANHTTGSEG